MAEFQDFPYDFPLVVLIFEDKSFNVLAFGPFYVLKT